MSPLSARRRQDIGNVSNAARKVVSSQPCTWVLIFAPFPLSLPTGEEQRSELEAYEGGEEKEY